MNSPTEEMLTSSTLLPLRQLLYISLGWFDKVTHRAIPPVFILCYHSAANNGGRFSMDTDSIRQQLDFLCQHYLSVSLDDVVDFIAGQKTFSQPAFAITFDDGYSSLLALQDIPTTYKIKPTIFALAKPQAAVRQELASQESFLTIEQLQTLHKSGWEIGCHSATHPSFNNLPSQAIAGEISKAKKTLENALHLPIKYFAYPKGAYTKEILQQVATAGYKAAFSMDDSIMRPGLNMFTLPRIGVDKTHTIREFKLLWSPSVIALRQLIKKLFYYDPC